MNRIALRLIALVLFVASPSAYADDWPQWLGPKRDGVWRESGILAQFPEGGPKVLWRTPVNPGYTGPAVADGRVYVMDRIREKDDQGENLPPKEGAVLGTERVLCLDAKSGKILWEHQYDCPYEQVSYIAGPRTTPVVHQGKVYTLGTMGDLRCLNAESGELVWSRCFTKDYEVKPPLWGWSANLLVDGDLVYSLVGGEDHCVCAFNKDTGKEVWHALTVEEVGYAPPMIFDIGGRRQLTIFHTEAINALDPATGELAWSQEFPIGVPVQRPGITIATPRQLGDKLLFSSPHHGSILLQVSAGNKPTVLWKGASSNVARTDGLHCLINTPIYKPGHIYGVCAQGELRCLNAETGARVWEDLRMLAGKKELFGAAFIVEHEDRYFLFNDHGDLISARLTPKGYDEIDRAHILEPAQQARGRDIVWSHPAFANRCVYARNDKEIICVSLAAGEDADAQ